MADVHSPWARKRYQINYTRLNTEPQGTPIGDLQHIGHAAQCLRPSPGRAAEGRLSTRLPAEHAGGAHAPRWTMCAEVRRTKAMPRLAASTLTGSVASPLQREAGLYYTHDEDHTGWRQQA